MPNSTGTPKVGQGSIIHVHGEKISGHVINKIQELGSYSANIKICQDLSFSLLQLNYHNKYKLK